MDINSMIAAIAAFVDKIEKLEQRIAELEEQSTVNVSERLDDLSEKIDDLADKMVTDYGLEEKIQETVGCMTFTVSVE